MIVRTDGTVPDERGWEQMPWRRGNKESRNSERARKGQTYLQVEISEAEIVIVIEIDLDFD